MRQAAGPGLRGKFPEPGTARPKNSPFPSIRPSKEGRETDNKKTLFSVRMVDYVPAHASVEGRGQHLNVLIKCCLPYLFMSYLRKGVLIEPRAHQLA